MSTAKKGGRGAARQGCAKHARRLGPRQSQQRQSASRPPLGRDEDSVRHRDSELEGGGLEEGGLVTCPYCAAALKTAAKAAKETT